MQCSICLDDLDAEGRQRLRCGHTFHRDCIQKARNFSITTCPLCRNPMGCEENIIIEIISNVLIVYVTIMCSVFTVVSLGVAVDFFCAFWYSSLL